MAVLLPNHEHCAGLAPSGGLGLAAVQRSRLCSVRPRVAARTPLASDPLIVKGRHVALAELSAEWHQKLEAGACSCPAASVHAAWPADHMAHAHNLRAQSYHCCTPTVWAAPCGGRSVIRQQTQEESPARPGLGQVCAQSSAHNLQVHVIVECEPYTLADDEIRSSQVLQELYALDPAADHPLPLDKGSFEAWLQSMCNPNSFRNEASFEALAGALKVRNPSRCKCGRVVSVALGCHRHQKST